jgi:hypothetical protein
MDHGELTFIGTATTLLRFGPITLNAVPIHYDDYGVFTSALSGFRRGAAAAGFDGLVSCVARGDTLKLGGRS